MTAIDKITHGTPDVYDALATVIGGITSGAHMPHERPSNGV